MQKLYKEFHGETRRQKRSEVEYGYHDNVKRSKKSEPESDVECGNHENVKKSKKSDPESDDLVKKPKKSDAQK